MITLRLRPSLRRVFEWESGTRSVTELCDEYGLSRTAGYKWIRRYEADGFEGLGDLSRRPLTSPTKLGAEMVQRIVGVRMAQPSWGGRNIAWTLEQHGCTDVPEASTVDRVLRRLNLSRVRGRRQRPGRPGRPMITPSGPNDLWTADSKGQFRMRDGRYCYPLTVADLYSRVLLLSLAELSDDDYAPPGGLAPCLRGFGHGHFDNGPVPLSCHAVTLFRDPQ
jgi:transposase